jgi:acyl dehydratase
VVPGDSLRFEGRVTAADGRRVQGEIVARNQKGEEVLKSTFEAELPEAR